MYTLTDIEGYLEKGKWKKVIKATDDILSSAPFQPGENRFSFMNEETYYLYGLRNPDKEIIWLKNHSSITYCKGYALCKLKMYAEAEKVLRECAELDPLSIKVKSQLFSALVRQGKVSQARQIITAAQEDILSPYDACTVYSKMGYIYSEGQDYERAFRLCIYSLLFEYREGAYKELEYIEKKCGLKAEYEPYDEQFLSYAGEMGKALENDGVIAPFPVKNLEVLQQLCDLYAKAKEPEESRQYEQRLEYLKARTGG